MIANHISLMTMLRSISDAICEGIPEATTAKRFVDAVELKFRESIKHKLELS